MAELAAEAPPNDLRAEQSLIGLCLSMGRILPEAEDITPDAFYRPQHGWIWSTMCSMSEKGQPVDVEAVRIGLSERTDLRDWRGQTGGEPYLLELMQTGMATDAAFMASIVQDRAGKRRLDTLAGKIIRDVRSSGMPYEALVEEYETALAGTVIDTGVADIETLTTLSDFLGVDVPAPDWVIENYLCRDERLILTGSEGLGKSTLTRQLAMCGAAGMDPFTGQERPAFTSLIIDVENPLYIMQSRFHELRRAINAHGRSIPDERLMIDRHPGGMDLVGNASHRRWLKARLAATNPDLLIIGPIYKLFEARDERDEIPAARLSRFFDEIRTDYNCALILEAHAGNEIVAGKRSMRPYGSSLWRRWCDFGYGIRKIDGPNSQMRRLVEMDDWKGPRDPRGWPPIMESGGDGLPWVESVV